MICSFAACFSRPRYRVFRYRNRPLTTCFIHEVPPVALLGIRITLLVAILRGRTARQSVPFSEAARQPEQTIFPAIHCVPEDCETVQGYRRPVPDCWISRHKTPKRLGCRLLRSLRPKVIEILQQVQPHHPFQPVGLISRALLPFWFKPEPIHCAGRKGLSVYP